MPEDTLPQPDPNLFKPENESKQSFVKWGKVGDWIQGTLHERRSVKSTLPGQEGKMQTVYDFFAKAGLYHEEIKTKNPDGTTAITYKQIRLEAGDIVSLGGNQALDTAMRPVKIGQVFGVRFTETKPSKSKGFADQKVRKVYPGEMDPNYSGGMADTAAELGVPDMK